MSSAQPTLSKGYWADRPLDELKAEIVSRTGHRAPFVLARHDDVEAALAQLDEVSHENWVACWSSVAERYEEHARTAESAGQDDQAREAYLMAWTYFSIARYPCPSSAVKKAAYRRGRAAYLAATRYFDHAFERVAIPFEGRAGEGTEVVVYLHRPRGTERLPVVLMSGGIDQYKEEAHTWALKYVQDGLAVAVYDMPGAGECPVTGSSPQAERIYDAILPYLAGRDDLDGGRIALVGRSFGGYWSTKAAHTHATWLRAAVNWGGSVHHAFQRDWVRQSQNARSYLFELLETRAHVFGLRTAEEYLEAAPGFSLLTQGVLDQDCAPMLLTNGKDDAQVPIDDLYILLEYGRPKAARVFPGGHLGPVPEVDSFVREWVKTQLGVSG